MVTSALTRHSATDLKTLGLSQQRKLHQLGVKHCDIAGRNIMLAARCLSQTLSCPNFMGAWAILVMRLRS
jgi:tRNA A-37 threonylcarbamoyl transferase component Bud32